MKKRELTLSELLDTVTIQKTLEEIFMEEMPLDKPFTTRFIKDYFKVTKNTIYPLIRKLEDEGIVSRTKGNFANRNNVVIYRRVK